MIPRQIEQQITAVVEDVLDELDMRLYDIHFNHVSMMLRIFIDRESGGITIADCKKASQKIMNALDRDEELPGSYALEVSSPGIERQLTQPKHFEWAVGKLIEVSAGKEKIRGFLRDSRQKGIVIATDDGEQFIEFISIVKAKVVEDLVYGKRR
jgi:ribosome maturation factor RimP